MSDNAKWLAVLLPGIDGTGKVFGPFIEKLPAWLEHQVIAYPSQEVVHYPELARLVYAQIPTGRPYFIVAESFAGPLALQISELADANLKALVLCATFLANPRPWLSKLAPLLLHEWVMRQPPRKWMARLFVTGNDASDALLEYAFALHKEVAPAVVMNRLYDVFAVDVRTIFLHCSIPMLHLYGTRDHLILKNSGEAMRRLRPDVPSIGVDGPHYLLQTKPQPCMQIIARFLRANNIGE